MEWRSLAAASSSPGRRGLDADGCRSSPARSRRRCSAPWSSPTSATGSAPSSTRAVPLHQRRSDRPPRADARGRVDLRRRGHLARSSTGSAAPSPSSPTSAAGSAAPPRPCSIADAASPPGRGRRCPAAPDTAKAIVAAATRAIAAQKQEGALVVGQRRGRAGQRRAEADAGVEEGGEGAERGAAPGLGHAVDDDQRERGVEQREGRPHRQGADDRDRRGSGRGRSSPGRPPRPGPPPIATRTGPTRSGRSPPTSRVRTTIVAKAPKTVAPWPTPRSSRWRTTKAATRA